MVGDKPLKLMGESNIPHREAVVPPEMGEDERKLGLLSEVVMIYQSLFCKQPFRDLRNRIVPNT